MQAEELTKYLQRPGRLPRSGRPQAECQAARRRPHGRRGQISRRPQEPGRRRQQARLPPAQRHAGPRFHLDPDRRNPQRERGRSLPEPKAAAGKLVVGKAVEVGHIFKLGYKYTESMGARVLDENGKEVTPIMGSYGIGIERILTAAIEQSNDKNGFWLPASIAPFTVVVTVTNMSDAALRETGEKLAAELEAAGLDVLLDDRDERAGVKFKDADLVGIPYRINVGKKAAGGQVELVTRATATQRGRGID